MRRISRIAGTVIVLCGFVVACSETRNPAAPIDRTTLLKPSFLSANAPGRQITILDQCDPESFNTAIEPGTCVGRNGGMTFPTFLAVLQKQQRVPSWRFSPDTIHVPTEITLQIINAGGEVHTFTEVEEFGGGVVPILNDLSGLTGVASECTALAGSDFIPAGGQTTHGFEPGANDKYQCCIHPWMRAVTR
jgi:hypothetical protein